MTELTLFLVDGRIAGRPWRDRSYTAARSWNVCDEYVEETGTFLRLYGRGLGGEPAAVEFKVPSLSFSLLLRDQGDMQPLMHRLRASTAVKELVERANLLRKEQQKRPLKSEETQTHVRHRVLYQPQFYGFEPSAEGVAPKKQVVVEVSVGTPSLFRALLAAAEDALHDRPLRCGAIPANLTKLEDQPGRVLEAHVPGLHFGMWATASGHVLGDYDTVDRILCATRLASVPPPVRVPPLVVAAYDLECSSGPPLPNGEFAFPNARLPSGEIKSIGVALTRLDAPHQWRRLFLHTGPSQLSSEHLRAAEEAATARGFVIGDAERAPLEVRQFASEYALLRGFSHLMRDELRPDVLLGFNSDGFDAPFLWLRMQRFVDAPRPGRRTRDLQQLFAWGRSPLENRPPRITKVWSPEEQTKHDEKLARGEPSMEPVRFDSPGVAHWDVLSYAETLNLENNTLSTVSEHVLEDGGAKLDLSVKEMMEAMRGNNVDEWAELAIYNVRDSVSTLRILLAHKQVQFAVQLAAVTNCTLPSICAGGQQRRLMAMVGREVHARGMVFNHPSKLQFRTHPWLSMAGEKVKGAVVLEVEAGYYRDPIVVTDYTSLYPSLMISWNLCPSTLLLDYVERELPRRVPLRVRNAVQSFDVEERDEELTYTYHVLQAREGEEGVRGILPVVALRLLQERAEAKRQMKAHAPGAPDYELLDARQAALKVVANSLYGSLGAVLKGKLYCRPLAAITTRMGRLAIAKIQEEVMRTPGASVITGDTDRYASPCFLPCRVPTHPSRLAQSVMFLLKGRSVEEAIIIGETIAKTVTQQHRCGGAHAVSLLFEKVMYPSVFLAKKCYAYMLHKRNAEPYAVSMGSITKKRGTCSLLREAYGECEQAFLLPPSLVTVEQVRLLQLAVLRRLLRAMVVAPMEGFVKSVRLHEEGSYKASPPHVVAARRYVAKKGCAWPAGQRVQLLQAMPHSKRLNRKKTSYKAGDLCFFVEQFREEGLSLDLAGYLQNVAQRFCNLLHFTIESMEDRFEKAARMIDAASEATLIVPAPVPPGCPSRPLSAKSLEEWLAWIQVADSCQGDRTGALAFAAAPWSSVRRDEAPRRKWLDVPLRPALVASPEATEARVQRKRARVEEACAAIANQKGRGAMNRVPEPTAATRQQTAKIATGNPWTKSKR